MPDAAGNPYTTVAAILQTARLGFEGKYDLPPRETGDGFTHNDAPYGVAANLTDALADLAKDQALTQAVGAGLVENQIFMKRADVVKTAELQGDALRDFYVWYI